MVEYNNPLEGRLKFVIDNLETAHAIYENLGYIQGYMDSAKVNSSKMISEDYLREMELEKYRNVGIKEPQEVPGWVKDCLESMEEISPEDNETIIITEDAEIIVSDEVKECIQKGRWDSFKALYGKHNCSCCSAEITGTIVLIYTLETTVICERCFERLHKQIKGDYMKEDDADRDYWKEREREKAESMEVKEEDGDK